MLILLADAIVVLHLAYIAFIPTGGWLALRWHWVTWPHLAAVGLGCVSVTIGFDCPLTTWEQSTRRLGGQHAYTNGFVDHYLTGRVYPHGGAALVQVVFAASIVASYAIMLERTRHRGAPSIGASRRTPS